MPIVPTPLVDEPVDGHSYGLVITAGEGVPCGGERSGRPKGALALLEPIRRYPTTVLRALDDLGIRWTRPTQYLIAVYIAVYHKAAVAHLDEFVGPKS